MRPSRSDDSCPRSPALRQAGALSGWPRGRRFRRRHAMHPWCSRRSPSGSAHAQECPIYPAIALLRGCDQSTWQVRIRIVRNDPGRGVGCGAALREAICCCRGRGLMRGRDEHVRSLSTSAGQRRNQDRGCLRSRGRPYHAIRDPSGHFGRTGVETYRPARGTRDHASGTIATRDLRRALPGVWCLVGGGFVKFKFLGVIGALLLAALAGGPSIVVGAPGATAVASASAPSTPPPPSFPRISTGRVLHRLRSRCQRPLHLGGT